jgi:hypothetical protein
MTVKRTTECVVVMRRGGGAAGVEGDVGAAGTVGGAAGGVAAEVVLRLVWCSVGGPSRRCSLPRQG